MITGYSATEDTLRAKKSLASRVGSEQRGSNNENNNLNPIQWERHTVQISITGTTQNTNPEK